jgi:beta-lactamase superfamily II metal-dependent hydrolase
MAARIVVRSYVVGFGDCILVRIPASPRPRHMLIDFGKAPGKGGTTKVFPKIAEDIAKFCGNHLDLLVMTHEHLDHMEGFLHQRAVFDAMRVDHVWMSLPSHPDYYTRYPNAEPQRRLRALASELRVCLDGQAMAPSFEAVLENNLSNPERIQYLRDFAKRGTKIHYLARGLKTPTAPLGDRAVVRVLAPEKDVSTYYPKGRVNDVEAMARREIAALMPSSSRRSAEERTAAVAGDTSWSSFPGVKRVEVPPNLTQSDWLRLRGAIRSGVVQTVRFIDRAQNNTSLCFRLEVAGKSLLFPGDAELDSWEVMAHECNEDLGAVDFLKVSHHGSHNGTPVDLLDQLLPVARKKKAVVLVSTKRDVYGVANPVPDKELMSELTKRARVVTTDEHELGDHVELEV